MSEHDQDPYRSAVERLASLQVPPPSQAAKQRAMAMAMAEFEMRQQDSTGETVAERAGKQPGIWQRLRHALATPNDRSSTGMPFSHTRFVSGVGAVCVGILAVGIGLQYLPDAVLPPAAPGHELRSGAASIDSIAAAMPEPQAGAAKEQLARRSSGQREFAANAAASRTELAAPVPLQSVLARPVAEAQAAVPADGASAAVAQALVGRAILADEALRDGGGGVVYPAPNGSPRDQFPAFEPNGVKRVVDEPVSTFSVDVDTASYSYVRRMLNSGVLPRKDAVRVEELVNYFDYDYPLPSDSARPFQPTVAIFDTPWAEGRQLLHIGIKGYDRVPATAPRSHLVFLLDVSGSMQGPDKLPLVIQSMELLLTALQPEDTVAIVVYAGAAGTVLEPTPVTDKATILAALRQLRAGGSTAGAQGIRLAYELARSQREEGALSRVILATDGDFNVGINSPRELQDFVERQRDEGVSLSVLGFGQGNYNDTLMQALAQHGNGVAAYIDTLNEARKVLVDQASAALFTIASDVKIQVEFNPAQVAEYRLIGYETRYLDREDFNNDAVDAGDIGSGHSVTAIYDITPAGSHARFIDDDRYAPTTSPTDTGGGELAYLKIRYKLPGENTSRLMTRAIGSHDDLSVERDSAMAREARFATAVAGFGQLLRGGQYLGDYQYDDVIALALDARGDDPFGYRNEFVQLVRMARSAAAMQAR